jgi:hypothetical protein
MFINTLERLSEELGLMEAPVKFKSIYDDLVFDGAFHIVYGPQQSGKSHFVLKLVLGILDEQGSDSPDIWYFDADMIGRVYDKFKDELQGNKKFHYRQIHSEDFLTTLRNRAIGGKPEAGEVKPILILDSLKDFMCGLNMDSNSEMNKWWDIMKDIQQRCSAIIIIHHATDRIGVNGAVTTKIQGNATALTATAHVIFAVKDSVVRIVKMKAGDRIMGEVVSKPGSNNNYIDYTKYNGMTKNQMFSRIGYYSRKSTRDVVDSDLGVLWDIEQVRTKKLVKALTAGNI